MMQSLEPSWISLRQRINEAALKAGRKPEEITLLAVSKTVPAEKIAALYHLGQRHFAENYVQEALDKQQMLKEECPEIIWHFIGSIQGRKVPLIARHFDWVHGIEKVETVAKLQAARSATVTPLNICLQVNISGEESKHGFPPQYEALSAVLDAIKHFDHITIRGLMGMAASALGEEQQQSQFHLLSTLHAQLKPLMREAWNVLSMGMSGDFCAAIMEGATHVRIGSALFGERIKS